MITGFLFSIATLIQKLAISEISAKVYSVDLIGAALGALIISILLVPLTGIIYTGIIIGILNLLCALNTFLKS